MKNQNIFILSIVIFFIAAIFGIISYKNKSNKPKYKKTMKVSSYYKSISISNYKIHGIDVSHHQGDINWSKVAHPDSTKNIDFVFIRATVGTRSDRKFDEYWRRAKKNRFSVGAYHYYWPNINSTIQANNFISGVTLEKGDLPPVLDIEKLPTIQSRDNLRKGLKNWIAIVEKHYGVKPIIYTGDNFYMENLWIDSYFRNYPRLWIANYNNVKSPYSNWHFWQYSDRIKISGINELVDMNVFAGDSLIFNSLKIK